MEKRKVVSYSKYGYIFSIPFVLAFLIFTLYPVVYTCVLGFTDLKGMGNTNFKFLEQPFKNFVDILTSRNRGCFLESLGNTFIMWIFNFIPQILLALLLTAWFTDSRSKVKGQGLFKVLFYLPNIITSATVAILFRAFFGYPMGPINDLFAKVYGLFHNGATMEPVNFFISKPTTRGVIAFIQFWQWYGNTMVLLISGVIGIDPAIFEAADMDGANRRQTFFKITIPCIRTIILYVLVTSMIGGLNMFDIPQLLNQGNPDLSTLTTSMYIRNQAFSGSYMYNRAAAASMIMFFIIMALSVGLFFILRDKDEADLKKLRKKELKAQRAAAKGV